MAGWSILRPNPISTSWSNDKKKKIVRSLNSISNTIVFKNSELMNYMELYNVTSTVNLSSNRQQFNFTKKIYLSLGLNIFKLENFYLNTLNLYISFFYDIYTVKKTICLLIDLNPLIVSVFLYKNVYHLIFG